ncbi:MAG TPA: FAD-dependent monooxygenase [Nocardioides sp.]|nr:FAD-dependent monooxygenase [Nocardioides sp.]
MSSTKYTIVVSGTLSERFVSALTGVSAQPGDGTTRLDTEPLDQSQLHGLLERLRNLAIELVSVQESSSPSPVSGPKVLVVGAGIGGLATAVALRRRGIDAVVLEQAPELREVGAGISLWPNAILTLRRLGIDEVERSGAVVSGGDIRDWRGRLVHRSSTDQLEARFGAPLMMIERGVLHNALRDALGDVVVRVGTRCEALEQDSTGVRVTLAGGAAERFDAVIGADGLHSVVRHATVADGPPKRSGVRAWRSVVALDPRLAEHLPVGESWGKGALFGVQSLPGNKAYWYAATMADRTDSAARTSDRSDLLRLFGSWHAPIPELINATEEGAVLTNDLFDRPVPTALAFGRVALVGDAAHPMLPSLGQGACQAIEDGEAVADALAESADPALGLLLYNERRLSAATAAVTQSSRMSRVSHLRNPVVVALRNAVLRRTPAETSLTRLGPIIGGRPEATEPTRSRS